MHSTLMRAHVKGTKTFRFACHSVRWRSLHARASLKASPKNFQIRKFLKSENWSKPDFGSLLASNRIARAEILPAQNFFGKLKIPVDGRENFGQVEMVKRKKEFAAHDHQAKPGSLFGPG